MAPKEIELITFENEQEEEEDFLVLEEFKWNGKTYVFLLAMEDEETVLTEGGKPSFMVMRRGKEDFYEITDDEQDFVAAKLKSSLKMLDRKLRELVGDEPGQ